MNGAFLLGLLQEQRQNEDLEALLKEIVHRIIAIEKRVKE